eukprot:6475276-Amphidinium_carterae.1
MHSRSRYFYSIAAILPEVGTPLQNVRKCAARNDGYGCPYTHQSFKAFILRMAFLSISCLAPWQGCRGVGVLCASMHTQNKDSRAWSTNANILREGYCAGMISHLQTTFLWGCFTQQMGAK